MNKHPKTIHRLLCLASIHLVIVTTGFARPILSVDFNCGAGGPSPTEGGYQAFAPVSASNQAGPVLQSYPGLDTTLTTGTVSVTLAAGTATTATGNLTSRDRSAMGGPEFPLYYLYRDLVTSASGSLTVGVDGLIPNQTYQVAFYAHDDSYNRSQTITNYTTGSAGTVSSLSSTAGYAFSGSTAGNIFSVTQTATANSSGSLVFRISSADSTNSAFISGLQVEVTPSSWYLTTSQSGSSDWSATYASHWNSNSSGGGSNPTAIHVGDNFIHSQSGYQLRTDGGSSTFTGGDLIINGGAVLLLKTSNTAWVSTIPFLTTGGGKIEQGYNGIIQNLNVGTYDKQSGTTYLTAGSGRGIRLGVDEIHGSSAFTVSGQGNFIFNFAEASAYTGAINVSSGSTLTVEQLVSTGGSLSIATGGKVILNDRAYFTGITIAGTPLAPGIHGHAELSAAHPAVFTGGTSNGALVVYSPATPTIMRGMNLAGGEFGTPPGTFGVSYKYPTASYFDYYQGKGLTLMRVPFRWERIQPTLNTALDSTEMGRLDDVIDLAEARGMKVILDMHNYARHSGAIIGTTGTPVSAFRDVWRRLADHFKGRSGIYGYGLMNEPHGTNGVWTQAAQEATYGIREVDTETFVIVSGDKWSSAYGWEIANVGIFVADPVQRLIYEAHCYFDSEGGGSYGSYEDENAYPMIGVDRVRPFVNWLRATGNTGFVGEYGVPRGDSRWHTTLDNFLAYLEDEGVAGTYWAGGPGWGTSVIQNPYATVCEPDNGVDAPQIAVIADHP